MHHGSRCPGWRVEQQPGAVGIRGNSAFCTVANCSSPQSRLCCPPRSVRCSVLTVCKNLIGTDKMKADAVVAVVGLGYVGICFHFIGSDQMKADAVVAVVGLGYVGLPLAVEFGKLGRTLGFDL